MLSIGTITFLFTNLEGSTKLWEQHPEALKAALKWGLENNVEAALHLAINFTIVAYRKDAIQFALYEAK